MKKAPLLPLNAAHGSIGDLVIRRSVERHPDGKAAFVLSNDLDAADGLASRPKPHHIGGVFQVRFAPAGKWLRAIAKTASSDCRAPSRAPDVTDAFRRRRPVRRSGHVALRGMEARAQVRR
jgi:hypothetical protein